MLGWSSWTVRSVWGMLGPCGEQPDLLEGGSVSQPKKMSFNRGRVGVKRMKETEKRMGHSAYCLGGLFTDSSELARNWHHRPSLHRWKLRLRNRKYWLKVTEMAFECRSMQVSRLCPAYQPARVRLQLSTEDEPAFSYGRLC